MSDRFFVSTVPVTGIVRLDEKESHHLARVRRVRPGQFVTLFDGSGVECRAEICSVDRHEVILRVQTRSVVNRELPIHLTFACCIPKGDRARWLIEKATELGVTRFIPLRTDRASEAARGASSDRMRRWVTESAKQCGRNALMEIAELTSWRQFLDDADESAVRLLCSTSGQPIRKLHMSDDRDVIVAVGPEGGLTTDEEQTAIHAGFAGIRLGPTVLRVETAGLAALSFVACSAWQPSIPVETRSEPPESNLVQPPSKRPINPI